jgi:acyl transferase domain-containing protein
MPKRYTAAPEVRRLLDEAGYAWDEQRHWVHPVSKRELDPAIAASLTVEQVTIRIAAGRDRKPHY